VTTGSDLPGLTVARPNGGENNTAEKSLRMGKN
jgi:hypothetical protein